MTRTGWFIAGLFALLAIAGASLLGGKGPAIGPAPGMTRADGGGPLPASGGIDGGASRARLSGANGLIVPVAGVASDQLVDSWGDARGGGTRAHAGLDIMAPRGTPVLAAAAGRVEKLFTSGAGGLTVYVRSLDGRVSYYYAHLDRYTRSLREGMRVEAGHPLGTVGDSGNAGRGNTHLHFGISLMRPGERWWGGRAVNPHPLLAGRRAGG